MWMPHCCVATTTAAADYNEINKNKREWIRWLMMFMFMFQCVLCWLRRCVLVNWNLYKCCWVKESMFTRVAPKKFFLIVVVWLLDCIGDSSGDTRLCTCSRGRVALSEWLAIECTKTKPNDKWTIVTREPLIPWNFNFAAVVVALSECVCPHFLRYRASGKALTQSLYSQIKDSLSRRCFFCINVFAPD